MTDDQHTGRDGKPTIEAIPTLYRGTTFRSRLEATWAASLDARAIRWEYEPEAIELPSGRTYIPDFWLPELGTWIEVKGPTVPGVDKAVELGEARACHCDNSCTCLWPGGELVLIGHPPIKYDLFLDPLYTRAPIESLMQKARRHPGFFNWSTAHGRASYYVDCLDCRQSGWFELRVPVQCRACRKRLAGSHASRPIDREVQFQTIADVLLPAFAMPE